MRPVSRYPSTSLRTGARGIESSTRPAGARNSSFFSVRASHWRLVTSKTRLIDWRASRQDQRYGNYVDPEFKVATSRRTYPAQAYPGRQWRRRRYAYRVKAENPACANHARESRRWHADWPHPPVAFGASSANSDIRRPFHRTVPQPCNSSSNFQAAPHDRGAGIHDERHLMRSEVPSIGGIDDFGPVQPLGPEDDHGQRGRTASFVFRAFFGSAGYPRWPLPWWRP